MRFFPSTDLDNLANGISGLLPLTRVNLEKGFLFEVRQICFSIKISFLNLTF